MRNLTFIFCLLCLFQVPAQNTIQKGLIPITKSEEVENISSDENIASHSKLFNTSDLTIKGFEKKLSDTRESFFITNHSQYDISRIKLRIQYTDKAGNQLHERTELVECNLPAGATRQIYIPSFDKQRKLYFYLSTIPKRNATPFKVAMRVLRYDIIAE